MNNEYSGVEKRRFKRVRVSLAVIYKIGEPLSIRLSIGAKEVEAIMLDLSESGIAILTNYNLPAGTVALIRFTLFKSDREDVSFYGPVEITGEVRYCNSLGENEYRVGICFTEIDKEDKKEINNFVEKVSHLLKLKEKKRG